ncbi:MULTISPECIES: hypothetical protein [Clostridia]|uniref:hypothetical protein n=1 Tax=Clostridia TaxID=186801 RepID=UPI001A9A7E56|nr:MULTISPECIES: hypothetical protein [Clostridia]
MSTRHKERLMRVVLQVVMILVSLLILIPLLIMLLGAFKNSAEVTAFDLALPQKWLFENFKAVFEQGKLLLVLKTVFLLPLFLPELPYWSVHWRRLYLRGEAADFPDSCIIFSL